MIAKKAVTTSLEWQVLDEDEPWQNLPSLPGQTSDERPHAAGWVGKIKLVSALLILLVASLTVAVWWNAERGARRLEEELAAVIATEVQREVSPHQQPDQGQPDPGEMPASAITTRVQEITFYDHAVGAQIERRAIGPNGESYLQRQRHFYHWTEDGWVRVPLTSVYLGAPRMFESNHFTFLYHEPDEATVEAIADEVDAIYHALRQDYGLAPAQERVTVRLLTTTAREESECRRANSLCIHSPALSALPVEISEREAMRLWIQSALVYQVRQEAVESNPFRYEWHYAESMLPHVQLRWHNPRVVAWHADVVRWLYGIQRQEPRPNTDTIKLELAKLCEDHQSYAHKEFFADATLMQQCLAPTPLDLWYIANYTLPERLSQLRIPDADGSASPLTWTEIFNMELLFDYIVTTYGREALPKLIEGFRHHTSWQTLVPAVLGVSAEEFESGWQRYLHSLG